MCERVSFVLSFYQKHTRQINQMSQWAAKTGRNGTARCLHPSPLPTAVVAAAAADDDELSLAQYVLRECMRVCVCVCIVQASLSLSLRSTAANFQGTQAQGSCASSSSLLSSCSSCCWQMPTTHALHTHHHNSCVRPYIYVRVSVCVRLLI